MEKRTIPLTSVETLSYYILADDFLFFKLLKKKKKKSVRSGEWGKYFPEQSNMDVIKCLLEQILKSKDK